MSRDPTGRKIGRNDPCWCGSGQRFKLCHYAREQQEPAHLGGVEKRFNDTEKNTRFCSCDFDKVHCVAKISKAHSISKRASLSEIADSGHVLTFNIDLRRFGEIEYVDSVFFEKKGVNNASTIRAFCTYHDRILFNALDNFDLNDRSLFFWQVFYRALCFERYRKFVAQKNSPHFRELDRGAVLSAQPHWQDLATRYELGHSLGFDQLDMAKVALEMSFKNGSYADDIIYLSYKVAMKLPVAAAGVFQPDLAPNGVRLQSVHQMYRVGNRVSAPALDHLCMAIIPSASGTILSFCSFRKDQAAIDFMRIFSARSLSIVDSFIGLSILKMENIFFRPSFISTLEPRVEKSLRILHSFGVGEDVKPHEMQAAMDLRLFGSPENIETTHNLDAVSSPSR